MSQSDYRLPAIVPRGAGRARLVDTGQVAVAPALILKPKTSVVRAESKQGVTKSPKSVTTHQSVTTQKPSTVRQAKWREGHKAKKAANERARRAAKKAQP